MKLSKTVSVIATGVLMFGNVAFAADTTSLTRAVVKLIKENHQIDLMINDFRQNLNDLSRSVKINESNIEKNSQRIDALSKSIDENKASIKGLDKRVFALESSFTNVKEEAEKAKKLVDEIRGATLTFETKSSKVVSTAKLAYERVLSLEKDLEYVKDALKRVGAEASKNASDIDAIKERLAEQEKTIAYLLSLVKGKKLLSGDKSETVSKVEKIKKVVVKEKCTIGCPDTKNADEIIDNYISK